jgi:adenine-specific DNA-methyltransferase
VAKAKRTRRDDPKVAETYTHPEQRVVMRPEVGTQSQFRKKKPPVTYRYDSSLSPALDWDGGNGARELGEWLLALIDEAAGLDAPQRFDAPRTFRALDGRVVATVSSLAEAIDQLKRLGRPFLTWTGKAERLSFDVPTLPLFVHERLSTKAIVETLVGHRRQRAQQDLFSLFGDPQHPVTDQVLRAYEYQDQWVNRLILGDSLVVMNSLLQYEGLGGQVQMIYIDPPYGVKFGSNFQPFVRKRDVSHNDDEDLTREPEMVKAYRDTWELGLHSYLTYMRDRLLLARELLTPSGSVFVQISDENVHHVRELMDEVFGADNLCAVIVMQKTSGMSSPTAAVNVLATISDFVLWYARSRDSVKYRQLYLPKRLTPDDLMLYWIEDQDGSRRRVSPEERAGSGVLEHSRLFRLDPVISAGFSEQLSQPLTFEGKTYTLSGNHHWKTTAQGMTALFQKRRLMDSAGTLRYVRFVNDFPVSPLQNIWDDTGTGQFTEQRLYVVQTSVKAVARCILMTTDPGDLVLDPTCGSGTTAYVAEQWGRRWITVDTSRVPVALAKQRLLTATYPYYQLQDADRGPAGGFVYTRRQNRKGEEVGGIVPHITLKSIANDEPPEEEVLVDRPEKDERYVRVSGPFTLEATIPTPVDWDTDGVEDSGSEEAESHGSFIDRMTEVLRRSPVLHVGGGRTVTLWNVRQPAKTLSLSAEAMAVNGDEKPVSFVFGPENGAVSEKLVHAALQEATLKSYTHLYVIGFAIQPHARDLIEKANAMGLVPATYVQATPDLMMGDLLKNMRSSQIFSVCGLPDVTIHRQAAKGDDPATYQVELLGVDTFDPITMDTDPQPGANVPAWLLDTDYNDLCFHVSQAFFPRTSAWEGLRKALKADFDDSVWEHLAGTMSAPFEAGDHGQIAVKVIDDRGNELLVVKKLTDR